MNRAAIFHCSAFSGAYPVSEDMLCIRLWTGQDDAAAVKVHFRNLYEHEAPMMVAPMEKLYFDGQRDIYEARIQVTEKRFKYLFEIWGDEHIFYTSDGFLTDWQEGNCFFYPYINADELPDLPEWAEGRLIYQVLVDRFKNGNPDNDPAGCRDWGALPDSHTYYGGDFEGLADELPYFEALGAEILYLSPVFASPTYHKYDICDYYRIEDIYGGGDGLGRLVAKAHSRGIRIILDGVFNHCSSSHPFFRDVLEKQQASPYWDWFCIYGTPVSETAANYDSFGGLVPQMPRWNTANPAVIDYLTETAVYWTRQLGVDGWRLDVADEVAHRFWRELQRKLKAVREDILIIGEIWNHASQWLCGDEMHTVTNYKFRNAILEYAKGRLDAPAFWQAIDRVRGLYKTPVHTYLVNLAGSHDVARIFNVLGDKELVRAVLMTLLMFQGMPLIYYGDEIGMDGGDDPDNRRAMDWAHPDRQLQSSVARVGQFRKAHEALRRGRMTPIHDPWQLLAFSRQYNGERLDIYVNFKNTAVVLPVEDACIFMEGNVSRQKAGISIGKGGMVVICGQ